MKSVFRTGITGQDGLYQAQILLEKDYEFMGSFAKWTVLPLHAAY